MKKTLGICSFLSLMLVGFSLSAVSLCKDIENVTKEDDCTKNKDNLTCIFCEKSGPAGAELAAHCAVSKDKC